MRAKGKKCFNCDEKCIKDFLKICADNITEPEEFLYLNHEYPTTLEGQVVYWADEIAQCEHDLDDGISNGAIKIEVLVEELNDLSRKLDEESIEYEEVIELIEEIKQVNEKVDDFFEGNKHKNRKFIDKEDIKRSELVSQIIGFFIRKLNEISKENIEEYNKNIELKTKDGRPFIKDRVISFNKIKYEDNKKIEKENNILSKFDEIISSKIINSYEVNCFDGKAIYIINKLFKAYYSNPLQLPDNTLNRIDREIKRLDNNWENIRKGKKKEIQKQINVCKGLKKTGNKNLDRLKHKIFMRSIADFIAGMTDNFAKPYMLDQLS